MSFQGPGTGLSGTTNQLLVGYAQQSGYSTYSAGAGNINGYAPQAGYANQTAATSQTLQLISIQGNTQWGWQGQQSNPPWLWGSNQGYVHTVFSPGALQVSYSGYAGSAGNINGYAPSAGYANQAAAVASNINSAQGVNGTNWAWSGQGGTPGHLWGGNVGSQYAVWAPNQMYAGQAGYAGYAGSAGNINGYAPVAGYSNQLAIQGGGGTATTWAWSGQGGTPNHFWGSNDGSYMPVWQAGQMSWGYANNSGRAGYSYNGVYSSYYGGYANAGIVPQYTMIQQSSAVSGMVGVYNFYYNGLYTGYAQILYYTYISGMFNNRRSTGGNTADRLTVFNSNNGTQYGYWNGGWGQVSDVREKDDIVDLDSSNAYEFIKQLRPRKFKWKKERLEKHQEGKEDGEMCGFIAQEVLAAASNTDTAFYGIIHNAREYLQAGGDCDTTKEQPKDAPILGVSKTEIISPLVQTVQILISDVEKIKNVIATMKTIAKINVH